jgi:hypothetical protein
MGAKLSGLHSELTSMLISTLESHPSYRSELTRQLRLYQADPAITEQQALQWTTEKMVNDFTNLKHEIGKIFLLKLSQLNIENIDVETVNQCIARGAMVILDGKKNISK